jgi:acid stress chaperone HdeB
MKKYFALAAAAATLAFASTPSRADSVDMSTITCENLLSMKQDEVSFVLIWVQGYTAGANEDSTMDPDVLAKSVTDTVNYCQENKSTSVMNAVDATAEE